ncbi:uncharacterized protein [Rutidosis leptorrhynchoides]|uniref:uncharacterized protein n=1 Tax=Rutidosis leptorrhynchoides TaxID=125765 RepID=UPI003A99F5EC
MPTKIDITDLPWDPADRKKILDYDPNQRDEIRRLYMQRGPCQPRGNLFPTKTVCSKDRRFVVTWFDEYRWLEYSVKADKAYCLWCYLFRDQVGKQRGSDAFVTDGFSNWNKKDRLKLHEGDVNSFHNKAHQKCEDLMKPKQSIAAVFHRQSDIEKQEYRIRLQSSIDAVRYVMHNALPFRGHDESEDSINRGIFLETLKLISSQNENARNAISKAPKNCK